MPTRFYLYQFRAGETLRLKKRHPCGGWLWQVERAGSDVTIKCQTCSHLVSMPRARLEKAVKEIVKEE